MVYKTYFDRTDWRLQDDRALIEAAHDSGHELALVLAERLEDAAGMDEALADAHAEIRELDKRCDRLRRELEETRGHLAALMQTCPDMPE